MAKIAVDLTPLLPGGENGGAKIMVMELLRGFSTQAKQHQFILLTSKITHEELSILDSDNISRICLNEQMSWKSIKPILKFTYHAIKRFIPTNLIPQSFKRLLKELYNRLSIKKTHLLISESIDLLFCPFTAPFFKTHGIPVVSTLYDLQNIYYPSFFSPEEQFRRQLTFNRTCQHADRIICISDYVRQTVLENSTLNPDCVKTVHIKLPNRLPTASISKTDFQCHRYDLKKDNYLLYPANFWTHKNHKMLLLSFAIYKREHPESTLKLVFSGAPGQNMNFLKYAIKKMGLINEIIFTGYISDEVLSALISGCKAIIYPSLYEGFGMPALEAMTLKKPVLCSNVTSLPEITGNAAHHFDPRKPHDIAKSIQKIMHDPTYAKKLSDLGITQAEQFSDTQSMVTEYLTNFNEVIAHKGFCKTALFGIEPDGWVSRTLHLTISNNDIPSTLTLNLHAPEWIPHPLIRIKISNNNQNTIKHILKRGEFLELRHTINCSRLTINVSPSFQPNLYKIGSDSRTLSCIIDKCHLNTPNKFYELFSRVST